MNGTEGGRGLFGVGPVVSGDQISLLESALRDTWAAQVNSLPPTQGKAARSRFGDPSSEAALADLHLMKFWFDPIASGRRLREVLQGIPELEALTPPAGYSELFLVVGDAQAILTPEGRAVMWALQRTVRVGNGALLEGYIPEEVVREGLRLVHAVYREWVRQRLTSVAELLQSETASMRPTVAGLLLVLLINRNTSPARRLPSPDDPVASAEVSRAIAAPALEFARTLSDSAKASSRGVDLYRGWALGEIARRLGGGLHKDSGGIWIDAESENRARERLLDAIRERPELVRKRVPVALQATLREYERVRPVLNALGVAHERPANTRRLVEEINAAASAGSHTGETL